MAVFIYLLVAIFIMGIIMYTHYAKEKKRMEDLQEIAPSLGLTFSEKDEGSQYLNMLQDGFKYFKQGTARKVYNILDSNNHDGRTRLIMFDYDYSIGKHHSKQTIGLVYFPYIGANISMAPENFGHKISGFFGNKDINFNEDADFSKRYWLNSEEERRTREVFSPALRSFFKEYNRAHFYTNRNVFVFFVEEARYQPSEMGKFMRELMRLSSLLQ